MMSEDNLHQVWRGLPWFLHADSTSEGNLSGGNIVASV